MTSVWETSFAAPKFAAEPVWLHGDLQGGNLLIEHGRLSAVIDFGLAGVGDPACALMVVWSVLTQEAREPFRERLGCDDANWARGRGWARAVATIALDYYRGRNEPLCSISRRTMDAIQEDY